MPPGSSSVGPMVRMTIHALVVGLVLAAVALAETLSVSKDIGILALAAVGLPWSALYMFWPFRELSELAEVALFAAFAALNLVLHGCYWIARLRRGSHRP